MQLAVLRAAQKVLSLDVLAEIRAARFVGRFMLGLLTVAVSVGIQLVLGADGPMHFVPALLAACLVAWYAGAAVGVLAIVCATLAVNFFVLPPRYAWAFSTRDIVACILFSILGLLSVIALASLGTVLCRLRSRLRQAEVDTHAEVERRQLVESDYTGRLSALEKDMADLRGYVTRYERAKRYAHTVERRLGQLQFAITKFPLPIALIEEEDDLSIIEAASVSLLEISGYDTAAPPAVLEALGTLLSTDCSPVPRARHPVVRASKGEVVRGELALWRAAGRTQVVRVYAEAVVPNRLTVLALVPWAGPAIGDAN